MHEVISKLILNGIGMPKEDVDRLIAKIATSSNINYTINESGIDVLIASILTGNTYLVDELLTKFKISLKPRRFRNLYTGCSTLVTVVDIINWLDILYYSRKFTGQPSFTYSKIDMLKVLIKHGVRYRMPGLITTLIFDFNIKISQWLSKKIPSIYGCTMTTIKLTLFSDVVKIYDAKGMTWLLKQFVRRIQLIDDGISFEDLTIYADKGDLYRDCLYNGLINQ